MNMLKEVGSAIFKAEKYLRYGAIFGAILYGLLIHDANALDIQKETIIQECVDGKCTQRSIQLIPYQEMYLDKPRKGDNGKYVDASKKELKRQYQLKMSDYKVGLCYVDINKPDHYYYVTKVVQDDQMVWHVEENQDDPFWLKQKYFFFDREKFIRSHRKVPCSSSPNLGRANYVKECITKIRTGQFACKEERRR